MSPRTHVRVMSAQQPDASSCGHRSRQIGGVRGQRPAAGLVADGVARPHGRHDDVVGRRRAEARAHLADARAQRLGGQDLALVAQPVAVDLGLAQHARALLGAGHGGVGGPADAGQLGARSCGAGARRRARRRRVSSTPSARRRSATASGKSGGTSGRGDPELAHGADVQLAVDRFVGQPLGDQLVAAELLAEQALELRRRRAMRSTSSTLVSTARRPSISR